MRLFIAQTKPTSMCLYNLSSGDVLLVGEGDFSFSVAFVHQMKPCVKVIASSLLTDVKLRQLHDAADSNIKFLLEKGINLSSEISFGLTFHWGLLGCNVLKLHCSDGNMKCV